MPSSRLSSICQDLLSDCLSALGASPRELEDGEIVHTLRITTKRLRAAWKIGAISTGEEFEMERASVLRELSALLAGNRDLAVLVNLSRELSNRHSESGFDEVITHLESKHSITNDLSAIEAIKAMITSEIEAWQKVTFASPGDETRAHREAIKKSHQQAKAATVEAISDPDSEVWHNWRKRVKRLRYQREFLAEIQGRRPGIRDQRISRLGSRLGDRNDLANLTDVVAELGNSPPLRKALASEERGIMSNCRRLGRRNLVRT